MSQEKKQNMPNMQQPDDQPIKQVSSFQIKGNLNYNNINNMGQLNPGYNYNNYNQNNNNNFFGPILPNPMQGIPGNFYPNVMPVMQMPQGGGGQTFSSVPTTESNYSFSGGIYKQK